MVLEKHICRPMVPDCEALKFGFFAGLHGDEPAGTLACRELAAWALATPDAVRGYELHFFPQCNPSGCAAGTRHTGMGFDLNREFWRGSAQPEVRQLEDALDRERYDGIVALHSDDTAEGIYGFVSGSLLSSHVLEPALAAAESVLSRNRAAIIDGFPAHDGIIKEGYTGILAAPPEQRPQPLQIVFETPALAPIEAQVRATVLAVQTIIHEYRSLLAYGQNL